MTRQLRNSDMLARRGGDEFAALVSVVHNRAEVEEIVDRLVHRFDELFEVAGQLLRGRSQHSVSRSTREMQSQETVC